LKIAEAAKVDSGAMKTVAVMTMLFLPATFFAALFSMPLLQWSEAQVIQDRFWVYW
jgi:Mg2+ and Co2+ transporter CorA